MEFHTIWFLLLFVTLAILYNKVKDGEENIKHVCISSKLCHVKFLLLLVDICKLLR